MSTKSRLAALDVVDIDAHRGRCHFAEDCTQPWAKPSYDDAVGSTPQATRRHFFEMQYAAECYAQLIGRPHIRKPSEMPTLPAARSEWSRLKELEQGWQLLGSWHRPVFAKKKAFVASRPLWELEVHNHLCSILVGKKNDARMGTLNEESFRKACLEKPRSSFDEESFDGSTAAPEESVLASEDEAETSVISIPMQKRRCLSRIAERDDDAMVSDEVHVARLPLALRRVIGAAVAGLEETLNHAPAPLAKRIKELVCKSQGLI